VQDVLYLVITVVFFAVSWELVKFTGRLEAGDEGERKP
jgi:hypothetical protein